MGPRGFWRLGSRQTNCMEVPIYVTCAVKLQNCFVDDVTSTDFPSRVREKIMLEFVFFGELIL